jgi:hypothetical protein
MMIEGWALTDDVIGVEHLAVQYCLFSQQRANSMLPTLTWIFSHPGALSLWITAPNDLLLGRGSVHEDDDEEEPSNETHCDHWTWLTTQSGSSMVRTILLNVTGGDTGSGLGSLLLNIGFCATTDGSRSSPLLSHLLPRFQWLSCWSPIQCCSFHPRPFGAP